MGAGLESGQSRDAPGFQLLKPIRQGRQAFRSSERVTVVSLTLAVEMQRLDLQQWACSGGRVGQRPARSGQSTVSERSATINPILAGLGNVHRQQTIEIQLEQSA